MRRFEWSKEENRCFGCGDNPYGLGLEFKDDGDWVTARTELSEHYQGFKEIAHGGIVALLIDEAAGWAIMLQKGIVAPSYDLSLRLRQPVPLKEEILVRGRVKEARHNIFIAEAQILNDGREILASGKIKSKKIKG